MQQKPFSVSFANSIVRGFFHANNDFNFEGDKALPVIIMGNGYATEWQFGTEAYVAGFVEAGWLVVNFDYRGFGVSDNKQGAPRQLVDIPGQLDDWRQVINFVKQQSFVDTQNMVFWGSSLGGGHALSMAAEHPEIKAVVAQVPHCDSREAFKTVPMKNVLKGMSKAMADAVRGKLGLAPKLIKVLGEPSEYAVMNHPGWLSGYKKIVNPESAWENAIPARSLLLGGDYRPVVSAASIACPALLVAGEKDAGVPLASVETTAKAMKNATLFTFPGDHFDVYYGPELNEIVQRQREFIRQAITQV